MKGVILAGGLGSRLLPLTVTTNKHLLPIYDKPMIYYPIETLVKAGIDEILIVTGPNHIEQFFKLLNQNEKFKDITFNFEVQNKEGGIAEALMLAKDFAGKEPIVVILGDNLFEDVNAQLVHAIDNVINNNEPSIFLKQVDDPELFGVAELDINDRLLSIEEKPLKPKSNYAVTGLYVYPPQVFDIIPNLKRSPRGELEITDVNNIFVREQSINPMLIDGYWQDAGTFNSLFLANVIMAQKNVDMKHSKKFLNLIKAMQNEINQSAGKS